MSTPAKKQDIPAVSVPKEEKVTLTAHHTHAGTKYRPAPKSTSTPSTRPSWSSTRRSRSKLKMRLPPPRSKSCRCFPSRVGSGPASACPTAS